jgi:Flp pilus assembly secretin CpaC
MNLENRQRRGALVGGLLAALTVLGAGGGRAGAAGEEPRIYVTVDRAEVVTLPQEPFTKVSVTNPGIADVVVISPTQLLVNGKTAGVTSLVLFHARRVQRFEVVVHPAPSVTVTAPLTTDAHTVLVDRAGKQTNHLFVRDAAQAWVELGAPGAGETGKAEESPKAGEGGKK